jgi:hypothetical protein
VKNFRDHHVEAALKGVIGAYRPEKTPRARLKRIAIVAALALATALGFWTVLFLSTPKPPRPATRPVPVELLPAPARR